MKLSDFYDSKAIAAVYTEVASNAIPYLGTGLFPAKKKMGLDLKWIKGSNGLPVSLMPSTFDAKSTFRDRIGVSFLETEMPFFRESMLIKEVDEQEIMRLQDKNDPYAAGVINRIFDDATNLINGANVVPERMNMQLLAPMGGDMGITIKANDVNYTYNYDPDGSWKKDHYLKIETAADKWSEAETCDPLGDLETALDMQETISGSRPQIALMSKKTFNYIKNSKKVQSGVLAQNTTANVNYTSAKVKAFVQEELQITIVIYNKMYKKEDGTSAFFYPDDAVMLMPNSPVGSTWYGTTPEERTLMGSSEADVSIVNTGVAVAVTLTSDPVNTKTTASEIVLPSFENMDYCYFMEVA